MQLCAQLMYSSSLKSSRPMNWSRNKAKDIRNFGREHFLPYQLEVLRNWCKFKWCFKNLSVWSLKWDNNTVSINCCLLLNHLIGHSSCSLKTGENIVTDWGNTGSCCNSTKGSRTTVKSPICWKCKCFILKCPTSKASTLLLHPKHFFLALCAFHSHCSRCWMLVLCFLVGKAAHKIPTPWEYFLLEIQLQPTSEWQCIQHTKIVKHTAYFMF